MIPAGTRLRSCTLTHNASARSPKTLSGSFDSAARDGREHCDLVAVEHGVARRGGLTVQPHLRAGEHCGEMLPVTRARCREDSRYVVAWDLVAAAACGLASRREETKHGHRGHDS